MDTVIFCDDDFWEQKRHDTLTVDDFWKDTDNTFMDECLNDFLNHEYSKSFNSHGFFDGYDECYIEEIQRKQKQLLENVIENRKKTQKHRRKRVMERMRLQRALPPHEKKTKNKKKFKRNNSNGQFRKSTKYKWVSISEFNKKR